MINQTTFDTAGIWHRFVAMVVDVIVLMAVAIGLSSLIEFARAHFGLEIAWIEDSKVALGLVIGWVYFAGLESSRFRATIGKMSVTIIVSGTEEKKLSFAQASWRYVAKLISCYVFFLGFLLAFFTSKKQTFHDIAAGTLVINKSNHRLNRDAGKAGAG